MRTKEVSIDEQVFKIAKLSCGQVDEMIFATFDLQEDKGQIVAVVQGNARAIRSRMCPVVAASLNNRIMGSGTWFAENSWDRPKGLAEGEKWWTPNDVFGEMDYEEIIILYKAVTDLSKLRSDVKQMPRTAPQKMGEDEAATASV